MFALFVRVKIFNVFLLSYIQICTLRHMIIDLKVL